MRQALSSLAGPGAEAVLELLGLVGRLEVAVARWQQQVAAGGQVAVVYAKGAVVSVKGQLSEVVEGVAMVAVAAVH